MSDPAPCNCDQALRLLSALEEVIRLHDEEWSDKYRETELASAMAYVARVAIRPQEDDNGR
tara:strand:- start:218 stop:400 length:183 start_codon:yes stop_codon:yes gene_type:complete